MHTDYDVDDLRARRRSSIAYAKRSNLTLAALLETEARAFGQDVLFYGNRRDAVRAVASAWANGRCRADGNGDVSCTEATANVIQIGSTNVCVSVSPECIEVDLDTASTAETKETIEWVRSRVSTRHVLCSKHVVLIHAAEKVANKGLARLQGSRLVVLVLSTCAVDAQSIASLSALVRMRVPAPMDDVPATALDALTPLKAGMTIRGARDAVDKLSRAGLSVAEIGTSAWTVLGHASFSRSTCEERSDAFAHLASLSHAAHGVSQLDRRALEAIVLLMGLGPRR